MRKFSKFEIAAIKNTAKSVNHLVTKKTKLKEQIEALQSEYNTTEEMQNQYEAPIKTMTGGYGTEDLVDKVVETTNSVDKNGNPIKIAKYVLKYPDTIIPLSAENLDELEDTDTIDEDTLSERPLEEGETSIVDDIVSDMCAEE